MKTKPLQRIWIFGSAAITPSFSFSTSVPISFVTTRKAVAPPHRSSTRSSITVAAAVKIEEDESTLISSAATTTRRDGSSSRQHNRLIETTPDAFLRKAFEEQPVSSELGVHVAQEQLKQQQQLFSPEENSNVMTNGDDQQHHYDSLPFSLIVNQMILKQALVIAATDPSLGLVLYGPKGTAKSVLARSLHRLLPLQQHHESHNKNQKSPPPMVQVPLHCQEDALLGTVDLERSLESGETIFDPGLLSTAHQGLLLVDDLHLLDEELRNILLNAIQDGSVTVEREGLSSSYPCRTLLVATMNPDEGEVPRTALDRIAMALPVQSGLSVEERVEAVQNVEGFIDHTLSCKLDAAIQEDQDLQVCIQKARTLLPAVQITSEQLLYLCQEATRADCEGQRAEIYATKIAKATAALQGRTHVISTDLQLGVMLAIAPRARAIRWAAAAPADDTDEAAPDTTTEQTQADEEMPPQTSELLPLPPPPQGLPPPPPPVDSQREEEDTAVDDDDTQSQDSKMEDSEQEDDDDDEPPELDDLWIPETFMFGVDATPLDPRLLLFQQWTRKGRGGKRSRIFNLQRGRFVKAVFPTGPHQGRIAVGATLRAAAPYQKNRREHDIRQQPRRRRLVYIQDQDIRIQRLKRKAGSLVIFVVDASGSMALNRMAAAKGACFSLLQEAYKSRDKIALINFHDDQAEVIVPPTKSTALTKARLEQMPCGGRSPLAHALVSALRMGLNAIKVKQDVGKAVIVVITDGRPTVPLCISEGEEFDARLMGDVDVKDDGQPSRPYCRNEVFALSKMLGAQPDLDVLVIDTEDKFVATGVAERMARLALGNYYALGARGNAADLAAITQKHVEQSRKALS